MISLPVNIDSELSSTLFAALTTQQDINLRIKQTKGTGVRYLTIPWKSFNGLSD